MKKVADEFRMLKSFHEKGKPWTLKTKVAVLHCWGKLRSWTLSGHFHETYMHNLIHINEALSGLPVDVDFIDFETARSGDLSRYKVIINAGKAGDAWSGGDNWKDVKVVEAITKWVYEGGCLLELASHQQPVDMIRFFQIGTGTGRR